MMGVPDPSNVKYNESAGWEPVPPGELPTHLSPPKRDQTSRRWAMPNTLDPAIANEKYGLQLYRMLADDIARRDAFYAEVTREQSAIVAEHYLQDSDAKMPKFVYQSLPDNAPAFWKKVQPDPVAAIAVLPAYFTTDEEADLWQCYIEDILRYQVEYQVLINDLRRRMRALPYDEAQYPRLVVKLDG